MVWCVGINGVRRDGCAQKIIIADPADIASTAGVSFTINHIAAVVIPVTFGLVWLYSPSVVFLAGAMMAAVSLLLSRMVPRDPEEGNEVRLPMRTVAAEAGGG